MPSTFNIPYQAVFVYLLLAVATVAHTVNPAKDDFNPEHFYDAAVDQALSHRHFWRHRLNSYQILFLTTYQDYYERMDRFFYDLVEAAERHPSAKIVVWGPGFPGWEQAATVGQNVARQYNCDFTFMYFANGAVGLQVGGREKLQPCTKMVVIEEMHDCHHYYCINKYQTGQASDIVIARYAFILLELFDKYDPRSPTYSDNSTVRLLAHNPDCADYHKVRPKHWQDKKNIPGKKAILIGATEGSLYPLRWKVRFGLENNKVHNIEQYQHPGYRLRKVDPLAPPQPYDASSEVSQVFNQQYQVYTNALTDAYICVFDSSVVKKTIRKYMESMLAGCVVGSDIPHDMLGPLHDLLIPLNGAWRSADIDQVIGMNLAHESHLQELAGRGLHYALQHFTCEAKFDRLLDIYDTFKQGQYGYYFPYGFKATCGHNYVTKPNPNIWCQPKPKPSSPPPTVTSKLRRFLHI